jgi:hypothetical protein
MKQKKTISICMFALCFFLFVYSQDYADETDVDVWISKHQTEIRIMKREDWLKLDETLKRPVYRKFTEEQCYHFWIDKVNEVMRSFDWNELEKIHLNLLLNTLSNNPKWFENDKIESLEKIGKEAKAKKYYTVRGKVLRIAFHLQTVGRLRRLPQVETAHAVTTMTMHKIASCTVYFYYL